MRSMLMRYRHIGSVCLGLLAGAAFAQATPPASTLSDSWAAVQPAHSGSAGYRSTPPSSTDGTAATGHFKFQPRQPVAPAEPPPDGSMNMAPIFGAGQIGADGRPPVNCPENPRDPACR